MLAETHDLYPSVTYGWANQDYAGDLAGWAMTLLSITLTIVQRPANQKGFVILARRWVVERTIAWLNRCRRLSKDFEHRVKNRAATVYLASIQRMLRHLEPLPHHEPANNRKK